jgi:hypothetical protein
MPIDTTGPSSSQSAYLLPRADDVQITALITTGDSVPGAVRADGSAWRFGGVPDGIGAFSNPDGSVTVLVGHEFTSAEGLVHALGAKGAYVDALTIDPNTLQVLAAHELGTSLHLYDPTSGTWSVGSSALNRLCSADLAAPSAFYDAASGLGTTARLLLDGEETAPDGRALAWIASGDHQGEVWELPGLGNYAIENLLASPNTGSRTIVIGDDDSTPGQLYLYAGDKQATGTEIEKAGLVGGKLYGIAADFSTETQAGTSLAGSFHLANLGDVSPRNGTELQQYSDASGVSQWLRPEDGAWDTLSPNRYYFVTTDAIDKPSRLWALDFYDVKHPEWGGRYTALLDGTEGQQMLDNITVAADGKLVLLEDPGNYPGASKVWQYDPKTDTLREIAQHDPARFGDNSPAKPPFTQDEESSGVLDVTSLFTHQPGQQVFLVDTQAHYPNGTELVEGGQLELMYVGGSTGEVGAGAVDWNALAATVRQHFAETGTWW